MNKRSHVKILSNGNLLIKNASIMHSNFSGAEEKFNPKGIRYVDVSIPKAIANKLTANGWGVKMSNDQCVIRVHIKFVHNVYDPDIQWRHNDSEDFSNSRTIDKNIDHLDVVDLIVEEMTVAPWRWTYMGHTGVYLGLVSMKVTIPLDKAFSKFEEVQNG